MTRWRRQRVVRAGLVLFSLSSLLALGVGVTGATITFEGGVYEAAGADEIRPIPGSSIAVYGSDRPFPDAGRLIRTTTTNAQGQFILSVSADDGAFGFFHIRQTDREGFVSVEARSRQGTVRNANWVEFAAPVVGEGTFTDIRFWDIGPRPDLVVGSAVVELAPGGDTLRVLAQVYNNGAARSPATSLRARSGALSREAAVRPLGVRESDRVVLRFPIAPEMRGKRHTFRLEVDPSGKVGEFNEENNAAETRPIEVPSLPDLRIASTRVEHQEAAQKIRIAAEVVNRGTIPAPATTLQASSGSWRGKTQVPALQPGASARVAIELPIPSAERGKSHAFQLEVDPDRKIQETDEGNNVAIAESVRIPHLPDLTLRGARVGMTELGQSLRIQAEVENAGGLRSPATTVRAQSQGWGETAKIPELAPAATASIEILLPIPAAQRGRTHRFRLEVDSERRIAELDEGNNVIEASEITVVQMPDLAIRDVEFEILPDGRTLRVVVDVANLGGAPAGGTTVRIQSDEWGGTVDLRPLSAGGGERVEVRLTIPVERRGRVPSFVVDVDPENRIQEIGKGNNRRHAETERIPDLPDLAIGITQLGFTVKQDSIRIAVQVSNGGRASASASVLRAVSDGWDGRRVVPALGSGDSTTVEIRFAITKIQRGTLQAFRLEIDPANEIREIEETNNTALTSEIQIPAAQPIALYLGIGGGGAFIGAVWIALHRIVRSRRRRGWEEEARESPLPDAGSDGEWYVHRVELDLDTRGRRVKGIVVRARPIDGQRGERSRRLEGRGVAQLNDAADLFHEEEDQGAVRRRLSPIAADLVEMFSGWIGGDSGPHDLSLTAIVSGGTATCEFAAYLCVGRGIDLAWVEKDRWKGKVEGMERSVPIGGLGGFTADSEERKEAWRSELVDLLVRFLLRV